jgi:hypothetical protein
MKKSEIIIEHLKEHGPLFGGALCEALSMSIFNLYNYTSTARRDGLLIAEMCHNAEANRKLLRYRVPGFDGPHPELAAKPGPRFGHVDPMDPFGLVAKAHAAQTDKNA